MSSNLALPFDKLLFQFESVKYVRNAKAKEIIMLVKSCCLPFAPKLFCMPTQDLYVSACSFIEVVLEIRILAAVATNETTHNLEQECHNRERHRSRSIDRYVGQTPLFSKCKIGVSTTDEMMSDN